MRKRTSLSKPTSRPTEKLSPLTALLVAAIIGGGVYTIFHRTERTDPARSLSRAVEMLDFDPRAIQPLLEVADQETALRPWVALVRAKAAERLNDVPNAISIYRTIPNSSPAALDAEVALLKLDETNKLTLETITELEQRLTSFRRPDLIGEVELLRATSLEEELPAEALEILVKLRLSSKDPNVIKRAIEHSKRLLQNNSELHLSISPASALALIKALIREREGVDALFQVQALTSRLANQSPNFFEARLLEEHVLRVLKRNEEADHLLALLSADGPDGIADFALLKLAKNSWNADDHDAALSFLSSLRERFPKSIHNQEGTYIEARIFEETNQPGDAKESYEKLITATGEPELQLKSLHRMAWLYIRSQNFLTAAEYLIKIRNTAKSIISTTTEENSAKPLDFFLDEYLHANYWLAISLNQLEEKERAALGSSLPTPDSLLADLAAEYPFTYYGVLARRNLRFSDQKLEQLIIPQRELCDIPLPPERLLVAELLRSGGLNVFAQREIDWAFPLTKELDLKSDLSRAAYYSRFASAQLAVRTADSVLRNRNLLAAKGGLENAIDRCVFATLPLAYMQPFSEHFVAAASQHGIKKELLLAISRTESFFDPNAISRSGAIGLAQLLPTTAKYEGMKDGDNLLDIRVNLTLAAKHIARLTGQFAPTLEYAIAAYNAGAPAVNRWRTRYEDVDVLQWVELIGYPETKDYVKKVILAQAMYQLTEEQNSGQSR